MQKQKRKMQKYTHRDWDGKITGWSIFPKYEIGEEIRWPKHGCNLVRATVVKDMGEKYWLVRGRTGKESLAWKGCIYPD
jgi:hypothetical protein